MSRLEDTPGLFGAGVGTSTCAEFECGLCKTLYNKGSGTDEDDSCGEWVRTEHFAGIEICEECFERVERSVLHRIKDILPWISRFVEERQAELNEVRKHLRQAEAVGRAVDFQE